MTIFICAFVIFSFLLFYRHHLKKTHKISEISLCSICREEFLDKELHVLDEVSLCSKDYIEYKANNWIEFKNFTSDPSNPEESMQVYNLQKELRQKSIPSYITSRYFERDSILYSSFTIYLKESDQSIATSLYLHC